MKLARVELQHYCVTALSLTANRSYDAQKSIDARLADLKVEPQLMADGKDSRHWQVTMKITYRPGPDANVPYHFSLEVVGKFQVAQAVKTEKAQWLVETNATAVLYSTAREFLRSVMANGPYKPMLLPTVSFYEPQPGRAAVVAEPDAKYKTQ